jgi:two-component system nitrogen regulation response regulator GlnG
MSSNPLSLSDMMKRFLNKYFDEHGHSLPPPGMYTRILQTIEEPLVRITLERMSGNQQKTAKILGISRNTLRKKIEMFDIK